MNDWRIAALVLGHGLFFSVSRAAITNAMGLNLSHRKRLGALC